MIPIKTKIRRFCLLCKHHKLFSFLSTRYKLKLNSLHGKKHWSRVGKIGTYLSYYTGADCEVVFLFAYLHDIERNNENYDPEHGQRSAVFIEKLYNEKKIKISQNQLELLTFACQHHNNSDMKSDNVTIQTCWDADRLDLWRAGIIPDPSLLNTEFSKTENAINYLR
ncbi:MAG: hypothetical protein AB1333_03030 [Patescibacteria group bacterium]